MELIRKTIADLNRTLPIGPYLRQQPVVVAVGVLFAFPWVLILGWGAGYMAAVFYPFFGVTAYLMTVRRIRRTKQTHSP